MRFKQTLTLFSICILAVLWVLFVNESSGYFISLLILISFLSVISLLNRRSNADEKVSSLHRAVLITGCDTGFGHHAAKRLDSKGFSVFASCLFPEGAGANDLRKTCSDSLKIIHLDVTKDESVANVLKFVKENLGSNELWAVVNNAGIIKGLTVELSSVQNFKDTFDVNTFGPIRVTKAFLPLLKKSKGRIVNVTSAAARLVVMDCCAYTMSKYAVLAFSECLSLEMDSRGVKVISIEPEAFRTSMATHEYHTKVLEDAVNEINEDTKSVYGENYVRKFRELSQKSTYYCCDNIDIVIDDIESAICEKNPHHVYKPSRNRFVLVARYVLENLPTVLYRKLYMMGMKVLDHPFISFYDIKND